MEKQAALHVLILLSHFSLSDDREGGSCVIGGRKIPSAGIAAYYSVATARVLSLTC
jgi:hypothetical protein